MGKGTPAREKGLAKGDAEGQSTPEAAETSRHEIGSRSSEGRPVKMSQHSSWLVEISQKKKLHISDSLQMHKECIVSQLNFFALELTQTHIVRLSVFLFSHSLDCISCGHKEMCDTPIGTTR